MQGIHQAWGSGTGAARAQISNKIHAPERVWGGNRDYTTKQSTGNYDTGGFSKCDAVSGC